MRGAGLPAADREPDEPILALDPDADVRSERESVSDKAGNRVNMAPLVWNPLGIHQEIGSFLGRWLQGRLAEVLSPYAHLVFTLPHQLNGLYRNQPRWLIDTLCASVAGTLG